MKLTKEMIESITKLLSAEHEDPTVEFSVNFSLSTQIFSVGAWGELDGEKSIFLHSSVYDITQKGIDKAIEELEAVGVKSEVEA
jgi:TPP-dependent indolepyruvate ferredoxin oxidoreductase alpha subunit